MEINMFKSIAILFVSLSVTVTSVEILDSFGNIMEDPSNPLYKGQFYDPENNPLWCAFKDGV